MRVSAPLAGARVIELVGLGPGPFCGMLLADLGAEVLRVDRVEAARALDRSRPATNPMHRSKRAIGLDLRAAEGVETFLRLVEGADVVFEVFRPGVAERLGIGPDPCCARNSRLVYGRLTGWGQAGPLANEAGHDLDYLAVAGALEPLGRAGQPPTPPINVLGDFAGGGMLLAFGVVAALLERERSGQGQVIDAAMVDGAALMLAPFYGARASGSWGPRGTNLLDTGAPFYDVYETADGAWVAIGAIEPQFYAALLVGLGLADVDRPDLRQPRRQPAAEDAAGRLEVALLGDGHRGPLRRARRRPAAPPRRSTGSPTGPARRRSPRPDARVGAAEAGSSARSGAPGRAVARRRSRGRSHGLGCADDPAPRPA